MVDGPGAGRVQLGQVAEMRLLIFETVLPAITVVGLIVGTQVDLA